MHTAVVDILNGGHWHGDTARAAQPWRLALSDGSDCGGLTATRVADGWSLLVTDTTGRLAGPFETVDDAGEVVEYFEELIFDVVEHDLLPADALDEIDLAEIERLAMTLTTPPKEWGPGEWRMGS